MKKIFLLLLAATLTCSLATGEAWGRGGGGGGGGHGGGGHGGGYGGRGYGGYGGFGYGGFGGFGLGYGYGGYGGYYPGYYGAGYGGYDYPYPNYNNYSAPAYSSSVAPVYGSAPAYNSYYYSPSTGQPAAPPSNSPGYYAASSAPVQLEVLVPNSQAKVWVDGQLTSTQGLDRIFTTAPVETGYTYTYNVKVSWDQAGHEVAVARDVQVTPGRLNRVDFTKTDARVGATNSVP